MKKIIFNQKDIEFIKNNYLEMTDIEMEEVLNKSKYSIANKRHELGLLRQKPNKIFKKNEISQIILEYNNNIPIKDIAKMHNVHSDTIKTKLKEKGLFKYKNKKWNKDEIKKLRKVYPSSNWEELIKLFPNHNKQSIIHKASELKLKKNNYYWTKKDIQVLKIGYSQNWSSDKIEKELNYKFSSKKILDKANNLNLKKKYIWEEWELDYLKNNYTNIPINDICKVLFNRERKSIIQKASELKLKTITSWTNKEDEIIRNNYMNITDFEISKLLENRTSRAVKWRRQILNLEKPCNNCYSNGYISNNGQVFNSIEEMKIFNFIINNKKFVNLKAIGNNHKKEGKYVYNVKINNKNTKFYPDFVLEYVNLNNMNIKLNKPLIIEYYGMYNENKTNNEIINKYNLKTKEKEKFYMHNDCIYYIGVFPKDLTYNFKGLKNKLNSFLNIVSIKNCLAHN